MTFLKKRLTPWHEYFFVAVFIIPFVGVFAYNLYLTIMDIWKSLEIIHFDWNVMPLLAVFALVVVCFVMAIIKLFFDYLFRGGVQGEKYFHRALEFTSDKSDNREEAIKWFEKAAQRGLAQAQFNLGVAYEIGYGVTQDKEEAVKWYTKAAQQGFAPAQEVLNELKKS